MSTFSERLLETALVRARETTNVPQGGAWEEGARAGWAAAEAVFRPVLQALADAAGADDPCWLDHNGACQAHFIEQDCTVRRALEILG